jgi:AcrR family transcriptional regulator
VFASGGSVAYSSEVEPRSAGPVRSIGKRRAGRVNEIVDAAINLFHDQGYQATSLDDVARQIGLAAPSLYRHVRSKLEILEMCLERAREPLFRRLEEIVNSGAEPTEVLSALVDNLIDVILEQPKMAAVLMRERHNLAPESRARFERSQRLHVEEWVHVLAQVRPELGDSQARLMVRATLALLDGSADFVHDIPPAQARQTLHSMAISALLDSNARASEPNVPLTEDRLRHTRAR